MLEQKTIKMYLLDDLYDVTYATDENNVNIIDEIIDPWGREATPAEHMRDQVQWAINDYERNLSTMETVSSNHGTRQAFIPVIGEIKTWYLKKDEQCQTCGTDMVNGRCPQPAKH